MEVAHRFLHCLHYCNALQCLNFGIYAYTYCEGRLERYWNGLMCVWAKIWMGDGLGDTQMVICFPRIVVYKVQEMENKKKTWYKVDSI